MSASERLRELKVGDGVSLYALEDALPEIVAVVEAAERIVAEDDNPLHTDQSPGYYSGLGEQADVIRPALAALEEKLKS